MTISVPVAVELMSSDVIDVTQVFNPDEHLTSYPSGIQYQYNNNIYQNTGDTIQVKDYNAVDESTYTEGQILFKDNTNKAHYYLSGDFPKQPNSYTEVQDTGFDASLWTTRYSQLDTIPSGFVDSEIGTNTEDKPYHVAWKSDGTKFIALMGSSGTIRTYTCSTAWDIETRSYVANSEKILGWTYFDGGIYDLVVNSAGTQLILMASYTGSSAYSYSNILGSFSIGTAWDTSGTVTYTGHDVIGGSTTTERNGGIVISNSAQTEISIFVQGVSGAGVSKVVKVDLPSNWDCDNLSVKSTHTVYLPIYGSTSNNYIRDIYFLDSGTKAVISAGYSGNYRIYIVNVPTAYNIADALSSAGTNILSVKFLSNRSYALGVTSDRKAIWVYDTIDYKFKKYSMNTAWDIGKSLYAKVEYDVSEKSTVINRWVFKWNGSQYVSTALIYSLSGSTLASQSSTDTSFYATLDNDSIEKDAVYPITDGTNNTFMIKTIIWNSMGIYVRTHIVRYAETETLDYHAYYPVVSPLDIPQFALIGANNIYKPLDGKNYTASISISTTMSYTVRTTENQFDTVALGKVKADSISAVFKLADGTVITEITRSIDRKIDTLDNIDGAYANVILYSEQVMPENSTVDITLTISTGVVELGTIMLGQSLDAGFHRLSLKHSYKDFSTATYDPFGNLDYVEKQRIATYNGNVDIVITDYDRIVRLFTFLGKKLVIVNGSKNKTNSPDSQTVFASTQLIGRFMSFNCRTIENKNDIDPIATYDFTLEELA